MCLNCCCKLKDDDDIDNTQTLRNLYCFEWKIF